MELFYVLCVIIGNFGFTFCKTLVDAEEPTKYTDLNVACPDGKPFIFKNGSHLFCVSKCGPGMVLDGSTCINVANCTKPVLSDGRCMDLCPLGYVYVDFDESGSCFDCRYSHGIKDIGAAPCVKISYLAGKVVCFALGIILYAVLLWLFFSTKEFPIQKMMQNVVNWCCHSKMTSSDEELLINDDVTED